MSFNEKNEEEINNINNEIEIDNDVLNIENFNEVQEKNEILIMKKQIIIKILKNLINTDIKFIDDNYDELDILQIMNILNYLDKSFSVDFIIPNNNDNSNFYYQKEFDIIKNIYTKITKDYNINLNESLESLYLNFSRNSDSKIQNNNNSYYYIYDILYEFIILILILNKSDINNKDTKYLSPVDKIFICGDPQGQKIIFQILSKYLNLNQIIQREDVPQGLKSISHVVSLYTKIGNFEEKKNLEKNLIKTDENEEKNDTALSEQDYCKIILKKDYIISQLEAKIESLNRNTNTNNTNNENTFRELEEENEMNKKEIEDLKRMYDVEFELMASAVYGLGINLFFNKEQHHNEQIINNSSWLTRQKDYITESKV